jgi:flagellar hook-length control protein FliK
VFSVTSDTASSVSFQDTRPKPARDDQRSSDSFASLVDSIAADAGNNRPPPAQPDPPAPAAPQRPADDQSTASDSRPPRDDNRSDAPSNADSRNADSPDRNDNQQGADANGKTDANADAASKPSKPDSGKQDKKDSAAKADSASDATTASDPAGSPQPGAVATVPVAIVLTPVAVVPVAIDVSKYFTVVQGTPGNAGATAPLAIAAAALKAQQATAGETAVAPGQPVAQTNGTAQADATAQSGQAVAAAIAAATPVAAKTALKTTTTAAGSTEGTVSTTTGIKPGTADPAAASTTAQATDPSASQQHPVAKGDAKANDGTVDAAKNDASTANAPAPAPVAPSHDRAATADVQISPPDPGQQTVNAVQQPQLQPAVTAAIPAAQLTATVATHTAAVPLSGLAVEIAANAQSGKSRFDIRLDPAELGRIDVRMDVDRHGQVTSHVTVERPETLAMLRQDAPQLQRALADAGLKTGDGGLQFSLRDQSSSGQNGGNESGRNAQRLIISEEDAVPPVTAQRSYGRMLGSNSGVDIRI